MAATTAEATVVVCVIDRCHPSTPRLAASSAARPLTVIMGWPLAALRTSMSAQSKAPSPTPRDFITASLTANLPASVGTGLISVSA
jgi:hypothetical protein